MKTIKIEDLEGTEREVKFDCGMISNRPLLKSDGMGYSITKTTIPKGDWRHWHYKEHLETCYCTEGWGLLKNKETGEIYNIVPDTLYILDNHDDHEFKSIHDVVLICVFNPPLKGGEKHSNDGSYKV